MDKLPRTLITLMCFVSSNFFAYAAYASMKTEAGMFMNLVTAAHYSEFLNSTASSDAGNLYNQAMSSDPYEACIVRIGEPGKFHYEVIAGREDIPITYIKETQKALYDEWIKRTEAPCSEDDTNRIAEAEPDDFLSSNKSMLELETPITALTLALTSNSSSISESASLSTLEKAGGVIGLLGLVALCPELMLKRGDDVPLSARQRSTSLTLQQFREAAEAHPTAERFVLHQDGRIQPREADPTAYGRIRDENITIAQTLKAALQQEYPSALIEELLPHTTNMIANPPHLSAEKLQGILDAADDAIKVTQPVALLEHGNNAAMPAQDINTFTQSANSITHPQSDVINSELYQPILDEAGKRYVISANANQALENVRWLVPTEKRPPGIQEKIESMLETKLKSCFKKADASWEKYDQKIVEIANAKKEEEKAKRKYDDSKEETINNKTGLKKTTDPAVITKGVVGLNDVLKQNTPYRLPISDEAITKVVPLIAETASQVKDFHNSYTEKVADTERLRGAAVSIYSKAEANEKKGVDKYKKYIDDVTAKVKSNYSELLALKPKVIETKNYKEANANFEQAGNEQTYFYQNEQVILTPSTPAGDAAIARYKTNQNSPKKASSIETKIRDDIAKRITVEKEYKINCKHEKWQRLFTREKDRALVICNVETTAWRQVWPNPAIEAKEDKEDISSKIAKLENQIQELESKNKELVERHQSNQEVIEDLKGQIQQGQDQIQKLTEQNQSNQQEIKKLKDEVQQDQNQIKELVEQNQLKQVVIEALKNENESLDGQIKQGQIQKDCEIILKQLIIEKLENKIQELKNKNESLIKSFENQIQEFENKNKSLKDEIKGLESQNQSNQSSIESLENQIQQNQIQQDFATKDLENQIEGLKNQNKSQEDQIKVLKNQNQLKQSSIEKLENQIKELGSQNQLVTVGFENQIQELQNQNKTLEIQSQQDQFRQNFTRCLNQPLIERLNNQIEGLKNENKSLEGRIEGLESQNQSNQSSIQRLENRIRELENQIEGLKSQIEENSKREAIKDRLTASKEALHDTELQLDTSRKAAKTQWDKAYKNLSDTDWKRLKGEDVEKSYELAAQAANDAKNLCNSVIEAIKALKILKKDCIRYNIKNDQSSLVAKEEEVGKEHLYWGTKKTQAKINAGEAIQPPTIRIKAAFKKNEKNWENFSEAVQYFINHGGSYFFNHNLNYTDRYLPWLEHDNPLNFFSSNAAFVHEIASYESEFLASHNNNKPSLTSIVIETYNACLAAHRASAGHLFHEFRISAADNACESAAKVNKNYYAAIGTIWEPEIKEQAEIAKEAARFAEAINIWCSSYEEWFIRAGNEAEKVETDFKDANDDNSSISSIDQRTNQGIWDNFVAATKDFIEAPNNTHLHAAHIAAQTVKMRARECPTIWRLGSSSKEPVKFSAAVKELCDFYSMAEVASKRLKGNITGSIVIVDETRVKINKHLGFFEANDSYTFEDFQAAYKIVNDIINDIETNGYIYGTQANVLQLTKFTKAVNNWLEDAKK